MTRWFRRDPGAADSGAVGLLDGLWEIPSATQVPEFAWSPPSDAGLHEPSWQCDTLEQPLDPLPPTWPPQQRPITAPARPFSATQPVVGDAALADTSEFPRVFEDPSPDDRGCDLPERLPIFEGLMAETVSADGLAPPEVDWQSMLGAPIGPATGGWRDVDTETLPIIEQSRRSDRKECLAPDGPRQPDLDL